VLIRVVPVSVVGLALATGALAQTTPTTPTPPTTPTTPTTPTPSPPKEHPDWFTSHRPYRPCPSSVAFNGRGACLGCPTKCRWHF
jgi:hypothetical protein